MPDTAHMSQPSKSYERLRLFDTWRGLSLISMVLFHLCYDLTYLYGLRPSFFVSPFIEVWRSTISWSFLVLAGCMCSCSRNNLFRGIKYLFFSLVMYVVTFAASIDTPISFGIIFCMGASTLLFYVLERFGLLCNNILVAVVLFTLFILTLQVPVGWFGIGSLSVKLPPVLNDAGVFSWLGFPGPHFASGDYYPLIPYALLYLSSAYMWRWVQEHHAVPYCVKKCGQPVLEAVGRHSLVVYAAHQPLILGLLTVFL